jgi:glutamate-5-semialdehyde dehydrogenase
MDCTPLFIKAQKASRGLVDLEETVIDRLLMLLAERTENEIPFLLSENEKDLSLMDKDDPRYDRLRLNGDRIRNITSDIRRVSELPSPLGKVISEFKKSNGLLITRVTVPFGVVGAIYEARPNVTFDVFSLCLKSGNACILKGGRDALNSNSAIVSVIRRVLHECNLDGNIITLLPPGRKETIQLLNARGFVDLVIPRGSKELIDYVRDNSSVPVIETGAGICHTYFDEYGDIEKGCKIINNAKTRRVSVCNSLDCLIVHKSRLNDLPELLQLCAESEVEIFADNNAWVVLNDKYPASLLKRAVKGTFGTEFLSKKMALKTVASLQEALDHISEFGSGHSEAIISENTGRIDTFLRMVDASAVYSNASTAFTDGAEFGLGAEIGISTQKLHARGPMALEELTTYKWIIRGDGQIRP